MIREVSDDAIIVLDWRRIRRHGVRLEGELRFAAVIIVHGCVAEDGSFQILQIVVIYQLEGLPVIIREPRDDNDHDDDDDDDDDEDEDEDDD